MAEKINIFWFRQDLRIADNPALTHAAESGRVLAVYILDQNDQGDQGPGAASRWWLHHSLNALNESLQGQLNIFRGGSPNDLAGSPGKIWRIGNCLEPMLRTSEH